MCNLSKCMMEKNMAIGIAKDRAKGIAENTLTCIKNLMETLGLSVDAAMAALKISEIDRPRYAKQLDIQ